MDIELLFSQNPKKTIGRDYIFTSNGTGEWAKRQEAEVSVYENEEYNSDPIPALLFGNFIAVNTDRKDVVLDIGCGISEMPIYVKELGLENFGLLPGLVEVDLLVLGKCPLVAPPSSHHCSGRRLDLGLTCTPWRHSVLARKRRSRCVSLNRSRQNRRPT